MIAPQTMRYLADYEEFNQVVRELQEKAVAVLDDEGFAAEDVISSLELDIKYGGQLNSHRASSPGLQLDSENDARAVYDEFEREYSELYSPYSVYPRGGVEIHNFVLQATVPRAIPDLPTYLEGAKGPAQAGAEGCETCLLGRIPRISRHPCV